LHAERRNEICTFFENIEEGKIKLPFPKICVIGGHMFDDYSPSKSSVNRFSFYTVSQDYNGILIAAFLSAHSKSPLHVASIRVEVATHDQTQVLGIHPVIPESQLGWMDDDMIYVVLDAVLRAIYMMTYHTGEVYISVPTPREAEVNEKKMRKGKKPLVEFRLISVTAQKRTLPSIPQGTHASPRQHWRRGHWRTYKSGIRAWVEPMLVGDEKNGKIVKDYVIGHYDEDKRNGTMRASKTPSQSQYHAPI
jgi:hypothetical protein